jgi:hypothetical protein
MFGIAVQTRSLILYRPRKASGSMAEAAEVAASVAASRPAPKALPGSSPAATSMPATSESRLKLPNGATRVSVTVSAAPSTPGIAGGSQLAVHVERSLSQSARPLRPRSAIAARPRGLVDDPNTSIHRERDRAAIGRRRCNGRTQPPGPLWCSRRSMRSPPPAARPSPTTLTCRIRRTGTDIRQDGRESRCTRHLGQQRRGDLPSATFVTRRFCAGLLFANRSHAIGIRRSPILRRRSPSRR